MSPHPAKCSSGKVLNLFNWQLLDANLDIYLTFIQCAFSKVSSRPVFQQIQVLISNLSKDGYLSLLEAFIQLFSSVHFQILFQARQVLIWKSVKSIKERPLAIARGILNFSPVYISKSLLPSAHLKKCQIYQKVTTGLC